MKFAYVAAALCVMSTSALADDCQKLANTTMCIEATNSSGGHWYARATFGAYDSLFQGGPMTLGGDSGNYACTGNNFARITYFTSTLDNGTWIAIAGKDGKFLAGTASEEPNPSYAFYKGRRIKPNGVCDPDTGPK